MKLQKFSNPVFGRKIRNTILLPKGRFNLLKTIKPMEVFSQDHFIQRSDIGEEWWEGQESQSIIQGNI